MNLAMPKLFRYLLIVFVCCIYGYYIYKFALTDRYVNNTIDYKFKMTSNELIYRIGKLKERHPELEVWDEATGDKKDKMRDGIDFFYFKFPVNGIEITVDALVRRQHNYPAILSLYSMCFSSQLECDGVIKDLPSHKRKLVEGAFKEQVVDRIRSNR